MRIRLSCGKFEDLKTEGGMKKPTAYSSREDREYANEYFGSLQRTSKSLVKHVTSNACHYIHEANVGIRGFNIFY